MYEQIAQAYGEPLQRTLQNQFKLATEAQPVAQFLAGLRASKAMKMQEEEAKRREALDEWNRQKFEEQILYNKGRDRMVDERYRDATDIASEDRQTAAADRAENNRQLRVKNFIDILDKGQNASSGQVFAMGRGLGMDDEQIRGFGTQEEVENRTDPELEGPSPAKKVTMFPEGATWMAKMTQAKDLREGKAASLEERENRRLSDERHQRVMEGISGALASHTINKEPAQRGEPPLTYFGRQLAAFTKLYGDPYAELPKGYEKGQGAMAAKAEAERLTAEVYGPNWKSGGSVAPMANPPRVGGPKVGDATKLPDGVHPSRRPGGPTIEVSGGRVTKVTNA